MDVIHPKCAGLDVHKDSVVACARIGTGPKIAREVKTLTLTAAGVRCDDGRLASGTSTDAVVAAATGRGPRCRFGGPVSELGAVVARAVREALSAGVDRWLEEHK